MSESHKHQVVTGWRGTPCQDQDHHGTIAGRCADCGKRKAKK